MMLKQIRQILDRHTVVLQTYCLVVLATMALGILLMELSHVFLPLLFALFFALLLSPLVDFLTCRSVGENSWCPIFGAEMTSLGLTGTQNAPKECAVQESMLSKIPVLP